MSDITAPAKRSQRVLDSLAVIAEIYGPYKVTSARLSRQTTPTKDPKELIGECQGLGTWVQGKHPRDASSFEPCLISPFVPNNATLQIVC
jgi:hypothetical protein